jgi:2-dehydro-3-deoxygalactonokinase
MVGARQGWIEAPYAAVPCPPGTAAPARPPTRDPRLAVHVLPGLRQEDPPDVMRGEETQVAGLIALRPGFDGVACLPGTHTKWAHVSAGEITGFQTFMTGELFALLATASVLRHTVADAGWSDPDFLEAAEDGLARPDRVTARLFALRAEALLHGLAPERARARLSGLLIGAELAGARPWWLGREVAVIGAPRLAAAYRAALTLGAIDAPVLDATEMTLAGLTAAHARITGASPG